MTWGVPGYLVFIVAFASFLPVPAVQADPIVKSSVLEAASAAEPGGLADSAAPEKAEPEPTPQQKMQARFPQPTMVGHLIGLPVLDGRDRTIGYVKEVVQDPDGNIKLIVPYAKWFGWARDGGWLAHGRRLVAVPIEAVAILALQIDALDMDRDAFDKAPTWSPGAAQPLPPKQVIKIAVQRR
jgi:PRC-barrel domain